MKRTPVRPSATAIALLSLLLGPATGSSVLADTAPAASQRAAFLSASAAIAAGRPVDSALEQQLAGYVLAPYLTHDRLRARLRQLPVSEARRFLDAEGDTQLGAQFRREFLAELARRGDWKGFLALDDPAAATSVTLRCQRLRARLAAGQGDQIRTELLAIWPTGQSLPDACDEAIAYGRLRGWLDSPALWQRLRLAADAGNGGLAGYLARQLPAAERPAGERLAQAVTEPEAALRDARTWPDQALEREAVARALRRQARSQVERAIGHWNVLEPRFRFAPATRDQILHDLALYAAAAYRDDAEDWFARVPRDSRSEQLAEWQLRAALASQDWPAVLAVSEGLPAPLAATPRPRYWLGRSLARLGREPEATAIYGALATEANFHGFLAADRLEAPYSLCPREVPPVPERQAVLRRQTDVARALELHAIGWRTEAGRAFEHARDRLGENDRLQLLLLASAQGWHDRVVFSLTTGDDLQFYELRFPVAEREVVEQEAARNNLDPAWTFALIRAESAWQPDARSSANALGLMQLMPSTGQGVARELGVPWRGTATLLDPPTNIRLGTRYLSQQAQRFQGSPWLATAAYNAGPAPVQRWLSQRSHLPADAFIETIPFRETREYVARVLAFSVIYDWRLRGEARPLSSRLPDPGRPYGGPPAGPHRPVICARPTLTAGAEEADAGAGS